MTALRRRATLPVGPVLAIAMALVAVGCGFRPSDTSKPAPSASGGAVPSGANPAATGGSASPAIRPPSTTIVNGFGKIDDTLPPSFPTLPGQEPADDTTGGPTSGSFVANMSVAAATQAIRTALSQDSWTVDVGSPLEDGSVVLEAAHTPAGCKTEVRFTPVSGTVIMSVLYGATCPFS